MKHYHHRHHKNDKILNNVKKIYGQVFEGFIFILLIIALALTLSKYKGNGPFATQSLETDILNVSGFGTVDINEYGAPKDIQDRLPNAFEITSLNQDDNFKINSYNQSKTSENSSSDIIFSKVIPTDQYETLCSIDTRLTTGDETLIKYNNITVLQKSKLAEEPDIVGIIALDNAAVQIDSRGVALSQSLIPSNSQGSFGALGVVSEDEIDETKRPDSSYLRNIDVSDYKINSGGVYKSNKLTWNGTHYLNKACNFEIVLPDLSSVVPGVSFTFIFYGNTTLGTDQDSILFKFGDNDILCSNCILYNKNCGSLLSEIISNSEPDNILITYPKCIDISAGGEKGVLLIWNAQGQNQIIDYSGCTIKFIAINENNSVQWAVEAESYSGPYFTFYKQG